MTYKGISESGILYAAVIVGLLIVALVSVIYLKKCYSHAEARGVKKEMLHKIIKSSITFSIVPAIAIVVGLVTLVAVIGAPYAWFRLSVLGSVVYELLAANMAMTSLGLDAATATPEAFGVIMWAMATAISVGVIFNIFLVKKVQMGSRNLGKGDSKWKIASGSVFMNALLLVGVVPHLFAGGASLAVVFTGAISGLLFAKLGQKEGLHWLGEFALAFSLIISMVASVFFDRIF